MKREVLLTKTAEQQMKAAADWFAEQNPTVAAPCLSSANRQLSSTRFATSPCVI